MITLPKVILLLVLLSTSTILIVGTILSIDGLIIGGVIGIFGFGVLGTAIMVHYNSIREDVNINKCENNTPIEIVNPLSV
jgi:hypothetical protein